MVAGEIRRVMPLEGMFELVAVVNELPLAVRLHEGLVVGGDKFRETIAKLCYERFGSGKLKETERPFVYEW